MTSAATWMGLEITKWSKSETKIIWYHLYVESKKNDTNELIHKTETDSQTSMTNLQLPMEKGREAGYIRSLGLTYTH